MLHEWWQDLEPNLAAKTNEQSRWYCNRFILPALGDKPIGSITTKEIEQAIAGFETGNSVKRKVLIAIGQVFNTARRWGYVDSNPADVARKPKAPKKKLIVPPEPFEVEAIRASLSLRDRTLVSVLAYAGLRPQEALGLRWQDVRNKTLWVDSPKTGYGRAIDLLAPLSADLNEWRLASSGSGLVFPDTQGNQVTVTGWGNWRRRTWNPLRAESTPYSLRHAFVSLLINEGRPITYVAMQAGHPVQVCSEHYAHVIADASGESAEEMIRKARRGHFGGHDDEGETLGCVA